MNGIGRLDWENWLYGLFSAVIGGGSGAVVSGITVSAFDPKDFNFSTAKFYYLMFAVFCVNGAFSFFTFLHQSPLPPVKTVTTTAVIEEKSTGTKVTTVQETKMTLPEEKK